jgi:hypothetical protein
MKLFAKRKDGGPDSNVTGYWLIEWKGLFSIALLRFSDGSREAYHSHAFNSVSWVLRGHLEEERLIELKLPLIGYFIPGFKNVVRRTHFKPSLKPIVTTRDNLHKVYSHGTTWALTFRGPWSKTWMERRPDGDVTLTNGRKIVG